MHKLKKILAAWWLVVCHSFVLDIEPLSIFLEGFTCFFSCLWDHNQRWRCYTADDDLKVEVKRSMDVCTRKGGADLQCPSFILDDRACNRDSAKIWKCPKDEQLQPKGCACNTNDVYLMLSIMHVSLFPILSYIRLNSEKKGQYNVNLGKVQCLKINNKLASHPKNKISKKYWF